jgi:hypothetical protein
VEEGFSATITCVAAVEDEVEASGGAAVEDEAGAAGPFFLLRLLFSDFAFGVEAVSAATELSFGAGVGLDVAFSL